MNEIALQFLEIEENENVFCEPNFETFINDDKINTLRVGVLGCGAIAKIITDFAAEGKLDVDLDFFYDQEIENAETLASHVDGIVVRDLNSMLDQVDLVIEAASQQAVIKIVPQILENGKDVIIMSAGALVDLKLRNRLKRIAMENNSKIYVPSGAIVGLDGIKAASIGKIKKVNLVTRKPPKSLGIRTDKETILYKGRASDAVQKFPMNMNVAATLSIACDMDVDVKIIADPNVTNNCHEIHVIGDFGEIKTTTKNKSCITNPKTSVLAAYSAIKLLNSLNGNIRIGT
jgi:aspartate dehydrogenase